MRTERAPTTALRGKNISEDALAISMAIFAASYAVPQCDSFDDPGAGVGGGLFVGLGDDEGFLRKRGIAGARITKCKSSSDVGCRCPRRSRPQSESDAEQAPDEI